MTPEQGHRCARAWCFRQEAELGGVVVQYVSNAHFWGRTEDEAEHKATRHSDRAWMRRLQRNIVAEIAAAARTRS